MILLWIMCTKTRCFLGKIYTTGKNITQPPVAAVMTDFNPACCCCILRLGFQNGILVHIQSSMVTPERCSQVSQLDIDNHAAGLSKILSKGGKSEEFRITTFSPNRAAKLSQILRQEQHIILNFFRLNRSQWQYLHLYVLKWHIFKTTLLNYQHY